MGPVFFTDSLFLLHLWHHHQQKAGEKRIRRNSLTTLHSLPPGHASTSPTLGGATSVIADNMDCVGGGGAGTGGLERQTTVPNGFNVSHAFVHFY